METHFYFKQRILLLLFIIFIVPHLVLSAQENVKIIRIAGGIDFDGIPDEAAWQTVEPFSFVMHDPGNGRTPVQKSDVRLCYDNSYLYMGSTLVYEDPDQISKVGKTRDYAAWNSDWIGISIDTYNDNQNLILFGINPNGIRTDASVKNDLQNLMNDINFSYNTFWDAKVRIIDSIWYSEIRIPFSSLRFQGDKEKTVMGITLWRNIANSKNPDYGRSGYPEISLEKGEMLLWKPSLTQDVEFEGLRSKKPAYITPYVLTGSNTFFNANENKINTDYRFDAGGDIKLGLSNNATLDLTINTDFAQVEADQEQFNLSRFSLFFPEKRIFFQEKSDVFHFTFNGSNNLFYSRNIGLAQSSPVRIYGGLRLTGRSRGWDFGFMDMQTASFNGLPGENFAVLRTKKTIINENSYVGGIFTSRISNEGSVNTAYGVDARIRPFGNEYINIKLAQTLNEGAGNKVTDLQSSQFYVNWARIRYKGFSYDFVFDLSGDKFNPSIGIETRENFSLKSGELRYGWLPGKGSPLNQHQLTTGFTLYNSYGTGDFESFTSETAWTFTTRKTMTGTLGFIASVEDLKNDFYIVNPDVYVTAGRYDFYAGSGTISLSNASRTLASDIVLQAGGFYDGSRISLSYAPSWNIGSGVIINGSYRIDHIKFGDRDQEYTNHIVGLRGRFMFTTRLSLTTYIQYNTFSERVVANARIRYNAKEGSDFYIVYNEGINSSGRTNLLIDQSNETRTFLLKYTYTFAF